MRYVRAILVMALAAVLGLVAFLLVGWAQQSVSTMGMGLYPALFFGAVSLPFIVGAAAFSWIAISTLRVKTGVLK